MDRCNRLRLLTGAQWVLGRRNINPIAALKYILSNLNSAIGPRPENQSNKRKATAKSSQKSTFQKIYNGKVKILK